MDSFWGLGLAEVCDETGCLCAGGASAGAWESAPAAEEILSSAHTPSIPARYITEFLRCWRSPVNSRS